MDRHNAERMRVLCCLSLLCIQRMGWIVQIRTSHGLTFKPVNGERGDRGLIHTRSIYVRANSLVCAIVVFGNSGNLAIYGVDVCGGIHIIDNKLGNSHQDTHRTFVIATGDLVVSFSLFTYIDPGAILSEVPLIVSSYAGDSGRSA